MDAVVVSAGFAGLYMLHQLRRFGLSTRVLEAGGRMGGTWDRSRYPGARCDVESLQHSLRSEKLHQTWQRTALHLAAEQQIGWTAECVAHRLERNVQTVEPQPEAGEERLAEGPWCRNRRWHQELDRRKGALPC